MISSGKPSNYKGMFTDKVSEADVLGYYLGITSIPCLIISPFRGNPLWHFILLMEKKSIILISEICQIEEALLHF